MSEYTEAIEFLEHLEGKDLEFSWTDSGITELLKARDLAVEVLEKQIPKNAELEIEEGEYAIFLCPNCNGIFHNYIDKPHYCEYCGQAIDWSDTE